MRRALLVVSCLFIAVPAFAADRDDSEGPVDFSDARATYNRATDEVVFVISTHAAWTPTDLVSGDGRPPGSVCVNVWLEAKPGEAEPEYAVCAGAARDGGGGLRGGVFRNRRTGAAKRMGAASALMASGTRLELRFSPKLIRRPDSFRYSLQATTFGTGCEGATGCEDFLPDRPETDRLTLGTPRSA